MPKSGLYSGTAVGTVMILNIGPVKQNGEDIKPRDEVIQCKPPKCPRTNRNCKHAHPKKTYFRASDEISSCMEKSRVSKKWTNPKFPKEVFLFTDSKTMVCKTVTLSIFFGEKVTMMSKVILSLHGLSLIHI